MRQRRKENGIMDLFEKVNIWVEESTDRKKREYCGEFLSLQNGETVGGPSMLEYDGFYKKYKRHYPRTPQETAEQIYYALLEKNEVGTKKMLDACLSIYSDLKLSKVPLADLNNYGSCFANTINREITREEARVMLNTLEKLLSPHMHHNKKK